MKTPWNGGSVRGNYYLHPREASEEETPHPLHRQRLLHGASECAQDDEKLEGGLGSSVAWTGHQPVCRQYNTWTRTEESYVNSLGRSDGEMPEN